MATIEAVTWDAVGPPDALPIVFVHGALMGRSVWRPQIDALADRYRCISVDLPGHGTQRDRAFELDDAVAGIVRAIDEAAGGRAVLVGLSLGGYVAMAVAGRHPERVRSLVVAGRNRVPHPAAGNTAFRTRIEPHVRGWAGSWLARGEDSTGWPPGRLGEALATRPPASRDRKSVV